MGLSEECTEAPEGGCTEKNYKGYSGEASRSWSLAPRLEHGNQSNKENQDGGHPKDFGPHDWALPPAARLTFPRHATTNQCWRGHRAGAVTAVTWACVENAR